MSDGLKERAAKLAAAARRLNAAGGERAAAAPFALAFATDRKRGPDASLVVKALPAGSALIFRDYDDPRRAATAARLRKICSERGVIFLVGGDILIARDVSADGVHLRADQLRGAGTLSGGMLVSASCHTAGELDLAANIGAAIALLGPAFPTQSHPGAPALGPTALKALASRARIPVLAIGGVDDLNAALLAGSNVAGFAAIGAFGAPLQDK